MQCAQKTGGQCRINTKASIVAISGALFALAMALMRIFCLPIFAVAAPLANVSVSVMVSRPRSTEVWSIPKRADFTAETSGGSNISPIRLLKRAIFPSLPPASVLQFAVRLAARAPAAPVKALALPVMTPRLRMRPPPATRSATNQPEPTHFGALQKRRQHERLENSASIKSGVRHIFTPGCVAKYACLNRRQSVRGAKGEQFIRHEFPPDTPGI